MKLNTSQDDKSESKTLLASALLLLLFALSLAGPVAATTFTVAPLTLVSGPTPFTPGCNAAPQTGTNFPNAEVEPQVAVNPTDSKNIVGVWQQDRWSNGGSNGLLTGVSTDGGARWKITMAHFSNCAGGNAGNGGNYERASDPWVTFGPSGRAYQISISFDDSDTRNAVLVSRSTDKGNTWSEPIALIRDSAPTVFNDKESVTADPSDPNLVYAVWDRLVFPQPQASAAAAEHSFAFRGPVTFSRTTDGGLTWEPPRAIFDPGENAQTIGNQIVVLPNGMLVDVFNLISAFSDAGGVRGFNVAIIRSTDKGLTWSGPVIVSKLLTVGVTDPDTGQAVRTGDVIPEVAVDPGSGALFLVWQDGRFSGFTHDDVAFSQSTDGGLTWSAPVRINKTPVSVAAFTPTVHVASDGTLGVTYYDFRNNTPAPGLPTDYWIIHCHASCTNPANWAESRITPTSFDMETAPFADGLFVGDYEGLTNSGHTFLPFFVQTNSGNLANRNDVFFTEAGP